MGRRRVVSESAASWQQIINGSSVGRQRVVSESSADHQWMVNGSSAGRQFNPRLRRSNIQNPQTAMPSVRECVWIAPETKGKSARCMSATQVQSIYHLLVNPQRK